MTVTAEILDIDDDQYHHDEITPQPSLSKSIIHILLTKSPAHAWANHPKNPDCVARGDDKKYDVGTASHKMFLEGTRDSIVVVEADSWRTNAAKEQRDAAYAAGLTPLLEKDYENVKTIEAATREGCDRIAESPRLFTEGLPERTLVWEEAGVVCKARLDWLRDDYTAIDDLKTTAASAAPEAWSRTALGIGADLQQAFYLRGARAVLGVEPAFRFVAVEIEPPYACAAFTMAPDALAIANAKIDYALAVWRDCLSSGNWPSYPTRLCHIHAPAWSESQWFDREARDAAA